MSRSATVKAPRYEVLEEIGRGSTAVVYRARGRSREVALKVFLRPTRVTNDAWNVFRQLLRRQADRVRRLAHRGIVRVYEAGERPEDRAPFLAMEHIQGPTLHELISRQKALDPNWSLRVADTLAEALDHARKAGVSHPDFKPANILLRESDGEAKITDFAVVRLGQAVDSTATHGSPAYRAPECSGGRPGDLRSDLFTLSVILYEMLCGKTPFGGKTAGLVRESVAEHAPTPITRQADDIAPEFDPFFERAMAKRPEDRFQDAASFRTALAAVRRAQTDFETARRDTRPAAAASPAVSAAPVAAAPVAAAEMAEPSRAEAPKARSTAPPPAAPQPVVDEPEPPPARPAWVVLAWGATTISAAVLVVSMIAWVWRTSNERTLVPAPPVIASEVRPPALAPPLPIEAPAAEVAVAMPAELATDAAPAPAEAAAPVTQTADAEHAADPTDAVERATEAAPQADLLVQPIEAPAPAPVRIDVSLKSNLKDGRLTLLLDGATLYVADLARDDEPAAARLEVPAGAHTIAAVLVNNAKGKEHRDSLQVDLAPGSSGTLRVIAGRALGRDLSLRYE